MAKCPNCGTSVEDGSKFCMECGTQIPQTKECPSCHARWPLTAKFCAECGYSFNAVKTSGPVIGDKNVIAGDVHIDQSSTINNNTVNNVTNTTTNVVNNVINQDETKKLVSCSVCGRQMAIVDAQTCKTCGKFVCSSHFDEASGKCSICHEQEIVCYKKKIEEFVAGGVIGTHEDRELKALAEKMHISSELATSLREEVEESVSDACNVVLLIKGSYLHVGREPIEKLERLDFDGPSSISANSPNKCYESVYAIDTVNSSISVTLDWTAGDVERHIEPVWGAEGPGPRNIQFVEGEESFGIFDDCPATLYVTETVASEDSWNMARVTFRSVFKVFGEFKPQDVCVKYSALGFDSDFNRLVSISYKGRSVAIETLVDPDPNSEVARDSWIETKDKRFEYNVWAPKSCRMLSGEIHSRAIYVAIADFDSLQEVEDVLASCGGERERIKELLVKKAEADDPKTCGLFLDAKDARMTVKKKCVHSQYDENAPVDIPVRPNFTVSSNSDVFFDCEDEHDSDRYVNSNSSLCLSKVSEGKTRISYFESGVGVVKFDYFCIDRLDPSKFSFYLQPTGAVDERGVPQMLIGSVGYSVPSYGKCEKYVYREDEMNEEIDCSNDAVKLENDVDAAWCVIEENGTAKVVRLKV